MERVEDRMLIERIENRPSRQNWLSHIPTVSPEPVPIGPAPVRPVSSWGTLVSGVNAAVAPVASAIGGLLEKTSPKPVFVSGRRIRRKPFFLQFMLSFFFTPIREIDVTKTMQSRDETVILASIAAGENRGFMAIFMIFLAAEFLLRFSVPRLWEEIGIGDFVVQVPLVWQKVLPIAIAASALGIIYWGAIGFFGHRLMINRRHIGYKIFLISINPSGVSFLFCTSALILLGISIMLIRWALI
jgi:hypothetical protein